MTLDPRIGMWLSIITAIVSALLLCGAEFTTIFGADNTAKILASLGILNVIVNSVNAVLHMIPSGPGQDKKFALGPAAKAVILLLATALVAAAPFPVHAQAKKPQIHVTGKPIEDIKGDIQDVGGGAKTTTATSQNAGDILNQLRAKFTADLNADLTSALTLAQTVPAGCTASPPTTTSCTPADTTAVPCYQALLSLNGIINSYTPPTDKPHVISDLEQLRIVARTIQSTNFKDACAPLVQDIQSQASQLVASILGIVSGAAKIGIAIP